MRCIIVLCFMLISSVTFAEDYSIRNEYGENKGKMIEIFEDTYSIRNEFGQETGRAIVQDGVIKYESNHLFDDDEDYFNDLYNK